MQGDVDFLVEKGKFEEALQVLEQHGFTIGRDNGRHVTLSREGVGYEIHRYFARLSNATASKKLNETLFDCIDKAELYELGEGRFPVAPPVENGLIILSHISLHIEGGIGLRQVLDWVMYANSVCDDSFWKNDFEPLARELGLYNLAVNLTYLGCKYFGLDANSHSWCAVADDQTCEQLLEYVLGKGDLGLKSCQEDSHKSFFTQVSNPLKVFPALQIIGLRTWKALDKHPWLSPFAWCYQGCRFVKKTFEHGYSIGDFAKDVGSAKKERKLLKKAGHKHGKKLNL